MTLNEYINIERSNKFGASAIKKRETNRYAMECRAQHIQPTSRITEAVFTYYHKDKRQDFDNVEAFQKNMWDGLVAGKIILNDTQAYTPLKRTHIHTYDKLDPRIEVEFTCD